MGLRICVGTDSLSSNWDLNFWNELSFIDERVPHLPFEELLQWATLNGAEALELKHLGRLEEGARPGLIHLETNGSFSAASVQKVTPINTRPA
jgi:cytosine/adenosine deaminase-related metal-dependent hydrolase